MFQKHYKTNVLSFEWAYRGGDPPRNRWACIHIPKSFDRHRSSIQPYSQDECGEED